MSWETILRILCATALTGIALFTAAVPAHAHPSTFEITVPNGDIQLAATLDLPKSVGPHPIVLVLHVSGAGERSFPSYRHLAETLPLQGIGVLRYDRRGSGASTGNFDVASFPDLASDARAVLHWARNFESVDSTRIVLWGMSQGGWIAPLVAAQDSTIAGVVIVSGAATTPAQQMIFSTRYALWSAGYPDEVVERATLLRQEYDVYFSGRMERKDIAELLANARSEPWFPLANLPDEPPLDITKSKWFYQFDFDPGDAISRVRAPVLLLFAERDPWIPIDESISIWKKRNPTRITISKVPGTNHFLAKTTDPAHEADPEPVSPEYDAILITWLKEIVRPGSN
ncbi:MAG TPA: alpha/beta hydrolase [bacterium]|nr:alpha/beta hydrolase [bacterium]